MKSIGIVRKVDELGRVVLPMELRRTREIGENTALEIFVDGDDIILRKYQRGCIFCGSVGDTADYSGKSICIGCARGIAGALK